MLKDREISQRTFGFISFSFLAHLGLIAATFLIPNVLKEMKPGTNSETYLVESPSQASLGESAQAGAAMMPPPAEQPAQVMTAPVDDSSAIVAAPEPKLVAKKVVTPARQKAETATKKVLALPSKKIAPAKVAQKVQTVDQSDLEVNQALKSARESEETLPEVAADIEVPEVNEEAQETSSEETQVATEEPAVESATTTSNEPETADVTPAVVTTLPAAKAAPVAQPAPAPQPMYAPIQRGAQVSRPSGQVGGLGTAGAPQAQLTGTQASGGAAGAIRDADSLMEQQGNAKPSYADEDQRAGRQGLVIFDAVVTKEGTVQAIELKQSSGHSSLDSSAYEAFKKHRYLSGQQGSVRKTFQFVLNGEETVKSRLRRR